MGLWTLGLGYGVWGVRLGLTRVRARGLGLGLHGFGLGVGLGTCSAAWKKYGVTAKCMITWFGLGIGLG